MRIVIAGAGGHGRVVLDILRSNHQFELAGFLDSNVGLHGSEVDGLKVLGDFSLIPQFEELDIGAAVIAIGDNRTRQGYVDTFLKASVKLVNAIHPSSNVAGTARVGKNVVIAAGTNVCTHAIIEDSVILNTGCIIDHESHIYKAAHICPGVKLAGHVQVRESAFIGIGATVIQGITIGESSVVGAGAVVLQEVPAFTTVVGVPAKVVKASHVPKWPNIVGPSTADMEPARSIVTRPQRRRPESVAATTEANA